MSRILLFALFLISTVNLTAQKSQHNSRSYHEDMHTLKKFFKKTERKGLYRHLKKLKRSEKKSILALHEKYEIPTAYMDKSEALLSKRKPTWKERRNDKRETSWYLRELRAFLIKNQVIKYTPEKGARLDPTGFKVAF